MWIYKVYFWFELNLDLEKDYNNCQLLKEFIS